MAKPKILDDALYQLLRAGNIEAFNKQRDADSEYDLSCSNLARIDLRGLNAEKLNLENVYFRQADLRGIDFRNARLQGASFGDANVSGCYFPDRLSASELMFSLQYGTRVRYQD